MNNGTLIFLLINGLVVFIPDVSEEDGYEWIDGFTHPNDRDDYDEGATGWWGLRPENIVIVEWVKDGETAVLK